MQSANYQRPTTIRNNLNEQIAWLTQYIAAGQHLQLLQCCNKNVQQQNNSVSNSNVTVQHNATVTNTYNSTTNVTTAPVHNTVPTTDDSLIDLTELDESTLSTVTPCKDDDINVVDLCNTSMEELQALYTDTCTQHIETLKELIDTDKSDPQYTVIQQNVNDMDNKRLQLKSSIEQLRQSLTPSKSINTSYPDMPALEPAISPQPMNTTSSHFNDTSFDTSVKTIDDTAKQKLSFDNHNTLNAPITNHSATNTVLPNYMTDSMPVNTTKSTYQTTNNTSTFNPSTYTSNYNPTSSSSSIVASSDSTIRGPNFAPQSYTNNNSNKTVSIKTTHISAEPDISKWTTTRFPWTSQIYKLNHDIFGNSSFRKHQREVINAAMSKQDVLVLMPTGGGKSLCYQLLAITQPGLTIVFSPLISLIQDQISQLHSLDVPAAALNAQTDLQKSKDIWSDIYDDKLKLLYITPEKFNGSQYLLKQIHKLYEMKRLNCFVVDESHCISSWGHSFRPDYLCLNQLKIHFPTVPVMCLTATANNLVQQNIIDLLGLKDCQVFKQSFNRTNLIYSVVKKIKATKNNSKQSKTDPKHDLNALDDIAAFIRSKHYQKTGIVYCFSQKECETVADALKQRGLSAAYYHAALSTEKRTQIQSAWSNDEIHIICATVAFGMGINKSNVRFVIHYTLPKNIENFYQESGRAGRDGGLSDCIIYYSTADKQKVLWLIENGANDQNKQSYDIIQYNKKKLYEMITYVENNIDCRRKLTLEYFNEAFDEHNCNRTCDNCTNKAINNTTTININYYIKALLNIITYVQQNGIDNKSTTVIEIFKGGKTKSTDQYTNVPGFGAAKTNADKQYTLQQNDIQRIVHYCISHDIIDEHTVNIKNSAFPTSISKLSHGKNAKHILNNTQQVDMTFRLAERAKSKAVKATTTTTAPSLPVHVDDIYDEIQCTMVDTPDGKKRNVVTTTNKKAVKKLKLVENTSQSQPRLSESQSEALFEKLYESRSQYLKQHPELKSDHVATKDFIERVINELPRTVEQLSNVIFDKQNNAYGAVRAGKYADIFLPVIDQFCREHNISGGNITSNTYSTQTYTNPTSYTNIYKSTINQLDQYKLTPPTVDIYPAFAHLTQNKENLPIAVAYNQPAQQQRSAVQNRQIEVIE